MNKTLLSISFLALFIFVSAGVYATCTPNYVCKDWTSCINGVQTRTCTDKFCGQSEITDRRVCSGASSPATCEVEYSCDDWTRCTYYDRTDDIISSQIRYSGVETRFCTDMQGCADSFSEERACQEAFKVEFVKIQQCGMDLLVAQDPGSKRPLAKVSIDAWRNQFLDISFIQNNFTYCPICYNGFRDGDETAIDCGGSCGVCKTENNHYVLVVLSSWIAAAVLFFSFLGTFIGDRKYILRLILYRAYVAIEKRDLPNLRKLSKKINSIYAQLSEEDKKGYIKEVSRFRDRLADFRIRNAKENI